MTAGDIDRRSGRPGGLQRQRVRAGNQIIVRAGERERPDGRVGIESNGAMGRGERRKSRRIADSAGGHAANPVRSDRPIAVAIDSPGLLARW